MKSFYILKPFCLTIVLGLWVSCSSNKPGTTTPLLNLKFENPEIRTLAQATETADTKEITGVPITRHSEMFIVFDDSGSMDTHIGKAREAVAHLLVNTAATAKASEIPFIHVFPLNSEKTLNAEYPYQHLIQRLKDGYPSLRWNGTPLASRVKEMSEYILTRIKDLQKDNKELSKIIVYIFTDGEPDGSTAGETETDWINEIRSLSIHRVSWRSDETIASEGYRNVDVQLTVLGEAMSPEFYAKFKNLQKNYSATGWSFLVNRTENIEAIEADAQALAERLLVDRLESRILAAKNLIETVESKLPSIKAELSEIKSDSLLNLSDPTAIEKLLNQAIEDFKQDQSQQTARGVVSEFRKVSDVSSEIIKIQTLLTGLKATALNLHQRLNGSGDDLSDIGKTIDKMTEDQRGRLSELISQYESVKSLFRDVRNLLNQSGEGNQLLHTEIENILQSLTAKTETVKKAYKTLFENSSSLIPFFESLPEDARLKIEADLALAKDVAIDYQNKTIIYTGVHVFKGDNGDSSTPSYQTDWTVVNRGTIVNLGGSSGGGAVAKTFINEGVILESGSTKTGSGESRTYIINNGKIIQLTQRVPNNCPETHTRCDKTRWLESSENICCPNNSRSVKDQIFASRFHWQRYDKNGKANFVIYNETDGSIYNVTWDFILNFKRGTTWGGKIYNFFARMFSDSETGDKLYELENIDDLQGDEAKAFLQSIYPERLKALRRTEEEWFALVPKSIIPVFKDILCIEMNGDLGYGKGALNKHLRKELEFKRIRQCGR